MGYRESIAKVIGPLGLELEHSMKLEIQHRTNNGYDTILAVKDGVVWADWVTAGNDEHMVAFRTAASDNDVADWGCWDNPQTIDAGENPDPDDWGTLVSRVSAS